MSHTYRFVLFRVFGLSETEIELGSKNLLLGRPAGIGQSPIFLEARATGSVPSFSIGVRVFERKVPALGIRWCYPCPFVFCFTKYCLVIQEISPVSWELGKKVFEKCATKLQPYLREAVKPLNLKVDDYAEIIASLCWDASSGKNMVRPSACISWFYRWCSFPLLCIGKCFISSERVMGYDLFMP